MELMRHSDMRLTTKIYTDSGMLIATIAEAVNKLGSILEAAKPAPQIVPHDFVPTSLLVSTGVHLADIGGYAGNGLNTSSTVALSAFVHESPQISATEKWCAMQGSNLRLLACEASALPLS